VRQSGQSVALIDTHCHVDLYPDPNTVIAEIEAARVYTVALTNTPSVFPMTEALVAGKRFIRPALGLHPELAHERAGELPLFESYLGRTNYVGEVGLDYVTHDESNRAAQRRVFERILDLCDSAGNKVLTVHSRRAVHDVVAAIPHDFNSKLILHWYSGPLKMLKQAIDKGCYFSVNLAMTRADKARKLFHEIPLDRLLTESDGPFVQFNQTAIRPIHMDSVIQKIATELCLPASDIRCKIYANFHRLLKG
jgi:TatD DNase family protein